MTYAEVGATRDANLPAGYAHLHRTLTVGTGRDSLLRAATALHTWRVHERAGLRVLATDGTDVRFRFGPFTVPCRIVYTVDEENRRGFAYGTLPGHPETGEELFLLTLTPSGDVRAEIRAFSRPATRLARLGGPLTRLTQQAITTRYLHALRTFAA